MFAKAASIDKTQWKYPTTKQVSCSTISIDEFASTTPVYPSIVNRNTNPTAHKQAALYVNQDLYIVVAVMKMRQRKTLIHEA